MLYRTDDNEIVYKIFGKGKRPLLLIHGNREDHVSFKPQIEYFQKDYIVIAADTRGHGKSTRGTKPLDFDTIADDFIGLIKEAGAEKIDIIGFSDGANAAMHIALKAPQAVGKLVLCGGNIFPKGMKNGMLFALKASRAFYKIFGFINKKKAVIKIELLDLMLKHPRLDFSQLKEIKSKTLVMAGKNDMVKDKHTKEIAASIPDSELKIIRGDHFIMSQKPDEVNEIIAEFLAR